MANRYKHDTPRLPSEKWRQTYTVGVDPAQELRGESIETYQKFLEQQGAMFIRNLEQEDITRRDDPYLLLLTAN